MQIKNMSHDISMSYKFKKSRYFTIVGLFVFSTISVAQELTLSTAIQIAQENSYDAKLTQLSFQASYWTYRSFKADLLPSINLNGGIMNFDHSIVETRNFEDGKVAYVGNNSLTNSLTLSVDQKITATGGTVSLQSYLYRLDQFTYKEKTYNSIPMRVSYTQPLRTYNAMKWEKKTVPVQYEIAQKEYMASMQDIAMRTTELFFRVLTAQSEYLQSQSTLSDREALYKMAQQRLTLGTTTKSEVLQMELSLLNARVAVSKHQLSLTDAMYDLFSYLRVSDYSNVQLQVPLAIPDMLINPDLVLQKAISNSAHTQEQKLQMLEAEKTLAQAKANRGIQMTLNGQIGFTQTGHNFGAAYSNLRDNEIVGLTLSLPIFDWGVSKGRVKMAQSQLDVTRTRIEQAHQDYVEELRRKVVHFNSQPTLCRDAMRAQEIAEERYEITRRRFETGAISVTDLNTAQQEMESAKAQYILQLQTFWTDYYALQKSTLHDWIHNVDMKMDVDMVIK